MRELRDILDVWTSRPDETFVLATVVDVLGSSYRKPGARMLIERDGTRHGLISGGCLEKDVARQAFGWTEEGPRTVVFDTRSNELHPRGPYGTGCEGVVQVLLERVGPDRPEPMEALEALLEGGSPRSLATVFASCADDSLVGTHLTPPDASWPAAIPERVADILSESADASRPQTVELDAGGGALKLLVEPLRPPLDLLIFGAGDDVRPLVGLADEMGWNVRVASPRSTLATAQRFPKAREIVTDPVDVLIDNVDVCSHTSVVIMTHDFDADAALVPAMLASEAAFVGLLGPRSRTRRLIEQMRDEGRLPEPSALERLQTPLGLDLGGESPAEVALSIVSAVLADRRGGAGVPLQDQQGRIHEPHRRRTETSEAAE